ncbi:hypothetical protein LTR37_011225 [Vermiconidia calcicola]|uniref:Uncharacterized protein n=1 Tax=Vermiconidia calcicola TaxID=1690605 RepID=A0ACC3N2N3_9PEZI|nr:hypothetical protein LTR37_011225 [Vermiconidia calcicola]
MAQPSYVDTGISTSEDWKRLKQHRAALLLATGGARLWSGFVCQDYHHTSAASPPTCPQTGVICFNQYIPVTSGTFHATYPIRMHDDTDAADVIAGLIESTKRDHAYICDRIETYGDVIANRWTKRNRIARANILKEASPKMYPLKHAAADLMYVMTDATDAARRVPFTREVSDDLHRKWLEWEDSYLAPYLDVQSLSEEPLKLLALMQYRAHSNQSDWVLFDQAQVKLGFDSSHVNIAYNPHCVITSGDRFDKLVQWEKEAAHRGDMIGYPKARLIFKAQQKISELLHKVVDLLLRHGLDKAPKGRGEWDRLVSTGFRKEAKSITKSPHLGQAFSPPPRLDVEEVDRSFLSRTNAAADELFQSHSDPLYVRHTLERIKSTPSFNILSEEDQREELAIAPLACVKRINIWLWVSAAAREFARTHSQYSQHIEPGKALPKPYAIALRGFEANLRKAFESQADELRRLFARLPGFDRHATHTGGTGFHVHTEPNVTFRTDPLFWNILSLCQYDFDLARPASFYLEFIGHILPDSDKQEACRVTQKLYDHLSDVAAIDDALSMIRYHRSYTLSSAAETETLIYTQTDSAYCHKMLYWYTKLACSVESERLWDKLCLFMDLPQPSVVLCRDNLKQVQGLHSALSAYWQQARVVIDAQLIPEEAFGDAIIQKNVVRQLSFCSTQECQLLVQREQRSLLQAIEAQEREQRSATGALQEYQTSPRRLPEEIETQFSTLQITKPKAKVKKRRPLQQTPSESSATSAPTAPNPNVAPVDRLTVSAKSIGIFHQMFSTYTSIKACTRWEDFVAAMVDAGCSATHNGGSAVTFEDERYGKGSIVVHRPQPTPSLDPIMLRSIGKRLTRRLGWTEDTFAEREKE